MDKIQLEQLSCVMRKICEKGLIGEYVLVVWGNDNKISILHEAKECATSPMTEIAEYALGVGKRVQDECKGFNS